MDRPVPASQTEISPISKAGTSEMTMTYPIISVERAPTTPSPIVEPVSTLSPSKKKPLIKVSIPRKTTPEKVDEKAEKRDYKGKHAAKMRQ